MEKSALPILACGGYLVVPSPIKKPGADLSAYGWLQLAHEENTHRSPLPYAGIRSCSAMDTYSQFPRGNCLPQRSIARGGSQSTHVPLAMGMMTALGVATMSASCVIRDEATRATYLDTVTTLVERVILSGPESKITAQGPKIEDVMDLVWRAERYLPLGSRKIPIPLLSR